MVRRAQAVGNHASPVGQHLEHCPLAGPGRRLIEEEVAETGSNHRRPVSTSTRHIDRLYDMGSMSPDHIDPPSNQLGGERGHARVGVLVVLNATMQSGHEKVDLCPYRRNRRPNPILVPQSDTGVIGCCGGSGHGCVNC